MRSVREGIPLRPHSSQCGDGYPVVSEGGKEGERKGGSEQEKEKEEEGKESEGERRRKEGGKRETT